jgi:flagellar motor component MotA
MNDRYDPLARARRLAGVMDALPFLFAVASLIGMGCLFFGLTSPRETGVGIGAALACTVLGQTVCYFRARRHIRELARHITEDKRE